ncbi:MAG: putative bifunctional diguanylate cyclase/phosphodiesterase [Clostridium sp.]|uniref:putative bifunctional diguanylate cyclase/phosphodiesterase n=1 Tax=Clostridium sp. TaxID=1506 RepID=UPI003D6D7403
MNLNNLLKINYLLEKEIVERKTAEEKTVKLIYNDELTGLPNRRYFNDFITRHINAVNGKNKYFAIMFLNLDNFKLINYTYGHQKGDALLQEFCLRIKNVIHEDSMFARVSGDDFLLLIEDLDKSIDLEKIELLSNKVMSVFKEPFLISDKENFMSVSMGVVFYPNDGRDTETLIRNADIALYEAKQMGKNNIQICTPEMKVKVIERAKLRNNLYRALEKKELFIYYQPQVDLNLNKIVGFEALLRWKPNKGSFVSPAEFIPLAEETGLIVRIGYWVIKTACQKLKKWHNSGFDNLSMAINLSCNQLSAKNFTNTVANILKEVELEPSFLEFEITERIMLKGIEENIRVIEELKDMGIKISIDDFGTEYSSFMNIKMISVDKIKIAMEFVQGICKNNKDAAIINSIIKLSHDLKVKVIAEGIETIEQLEYLRSIKCDEVQGYYYYKPMSDIEIEDALAKESSRKHLYKVRQSLFAHN